MDVRLISITKDYSASMALHGVDLAIASGELVALLGPSGSGKTTLLRIIAGLIQPTAGKVLFGDEDASHRSVQERNVGFVFQHYALFRHMTVFENIAFGLRVRPRRARPAESELRRRVLALLDLVQLGGLEERFPNQLSGGQRQRVALARALAIEPRVLLLDEPFGALDAKVRRELRRWLRQLHDETGHTTVFVTHDQEEALEIADRVVVMNRGRIEQVGSPGEVYDQPSSPFVFGFLGESSALPVQVSGGQVDVGGRRFGPAPAGLGDGPAVLHVRPHDLAAVPAAEAVWSGPVRALRRHGGWVRVELVLPSNSGETVVEADLAPDLAPELAPAVGRMVGLRPQRWRVFPLAEGAL